MNSTPLLTPATAKTRTDAFVESLKTLERHLQAMSDDLIAGRAPDFEAGCAQLAPMLTAFSHAHGALPPEVSAHRAIRSRMRALKDAIGIQRENMARRASLVDRELQVLLPADGGAIYGSSYAGSSGVYGRGVRTVSRSFTSLHA